jgi:hypothetical protein
MRYARAVNSQQIISWSVFKSGGAASFLMKYLAGHRIWKFTTEINFEDVNKWNYLRIGSSSNITKQSRSLHTLYCIFFIIWQKQELKPYWTSRLCNVVWDVCICWLGVNFFIRGSISSDRLFCLVVRVLVTDPEVQVRFPALPVFLRSSGSGMGSAQPHEHNWGGIWKKK